jgi:hypothetical protein
VFKRTLLLTGATAAEVTDECSKFLNLTFLYYLASFFFWQYWRLNPGPWALLGKFSTTTELHFQSFIIRDFFSGDTS